MDLFTKADKQKEFPDSNTVLIHLKSNGKFNVTIHDNFLTVSGVQYKKPGFTTGYLQIVLIGGRDARNGVSGAVKDENSITFSKKEDHLILEIKEYIENYIHKRSTGSATASNLDEIRKLKELLDIGAITDEEFEAKKAQLLSI